MRRFLVLVAVTATVLAAALAAPGAAQAPPRDDRFGPPQFNPPGSSTTWFLAEGTTRTGFDEFLLIFNPDDAAVSFTATYLVDGGSPVTKSYSIGPQSRLDIKVWQEIGREIDHGTRIEAANPIVVERAIYMTRAFDNVPGVVDGATNVFAEPGPQSEWHFAEGTTLPGFQTYYLVANPGDAAVDVSFTLSPTGASAATGSISVPPRSRRTISAQDRVGTGREGIYAVFTSASAFLAERAVYFNASIAGSPQANGAHAAFGVARPGPEWFLSEGNVLENWYEFLTIGNPGTAPLPVVLEYHFEGSAPVSTQVTVPAGGRSTVQVFSETGGGVGRNVSDPVSRGVAVGARAAGPFVLERPMYFPGVDVAGLPGVNDGHVSAASAGRPALGYLLAEGTTLSTFRSFWTFQNPNNQDAAVTVSYYTDLGQRVARPFVIPARQRVTTQIFATEQIPKGALGTADRGFAATIESTNDVSFRVERPIYQRHGFEDIGEVNGATNGVGRPGGPRLTVTKSMPGAVASGSQAVSTVTVEVTEGMAHGLTVLDTVAVDPTDGTDATYVPGASTVPAGFTCAAQTPSDVVCSAGDVEPGVYTFRLAFAMAKSTPGPGTLPDTAVAAALNADAAVTSSQTTVNP